MKSLGLEVQRSWAWGIRSRVRAWALGLVELELSKPHGRIRAKGVPKKSTVPDKHGTAKSPISK